MKNPNQDSPVRIPRTLWGVGGVLLVATGVFAWSRVGLLDLPSVPGGVDPESAGLAQLDQLRRMNAAIWPTDPGTDAQTADPAGDGATEAAKLVRDGILTATHGSAENGLVQMRRGIELDPRNLVLGNAYRMVIFKLRREFVLQAKLAGNLAPQFPPHLDRQPIVFFEELGHRHDCREARLQLAMSWVDEMLLFPALEIKAPASVEAVNFLTALIENGNDNYVPALFARGLNHLHRPARLVWPESRRTAPDAAVKDIARCVAIGRKLGLGSDRLQAALAMTLGDAYVKAGRYNVARSWWQIAQNLCRESDFQQAIRRRYGWSDEEVLDRLEEELDTARGELDHPMTDLALMWN